MQHKEHLKKGHFVVLCLKSVKATNSVNSWPQTVDAPYCLPQCHAIVLVGKKALAETNQTTWSEPLMAAFGELAMASQQFNCS